MEKSLYLSLLLFVFVIVPFQNCSKSFEAISSTQSGLITNTNTNTNTDSSSTNDSNANENAEPPASSNNSNSNSASNKTKICENNTKQIAFPGAEGFGRCAQGGRGGRVIEVTNLNDSGPGSLRDCMQQSGARTCVFRVSGIINLSTCTVACTAVGNCPNNQNICQWPTIQVNHPYLTVAGQTAPGDGIMIKGGIETGGSLNPVHDVILRHLRIRPGYDMPNMSAIFVRSNNSIVDHISVGWVTDEGIGVAGTSGKVTKDVTIQWSIFSEGSHGLAIGGGNANPASNVTVHHNYFAMNWVRNPQALSEGGQDNVVDIVNNVSYFWNDSTTSAPCRGYFHHNYVNNAFVQHKSASYYRYVLRLLGPNFDDSRCNYALYAPQSAAYVKGNIDFWRNNNSMPDSLSIDQDGGGITISPTRFAAPPINETDAFQAYKDVLANAGARLPKLDSIDQRALDIIKSATFEPGNITRGTAGVILTHEREVGGYPTYNSTAAPVDSDKDGMPDSFENARGLNPMNASDGALDRDNDGYTNLEEYLNGL